MAISFADIQKTTGTAGQRKGLEPYGNRVVSLTDFKVEEKGRGVDKNGEPKEKKRVLTATVSTDGMKPRRARIPVRYAQRFMEAMELRADEDSEPFAVRDVLVKVGEHGATLHDPNDFPRSQGGWADEPNENGTVTKRRPGRPKRSAENHEQAAA